MLRKCSICTLTLFIVQLRFCCSCCSTHIITVTGALRFDIVLLSHAVNSSRYPVHSSRVVSNVGAPNMIQCLMMLPNYPRQLRSSAAHVWSSIAPYSIVYSCILYALRVCVYGYSVPIRRLILTQMMVPMTHMTPKFKCLSL